MKPPDQYEIVHTLGNNIVAEMPQLRKLWMELNHPPIQFDLMSKFYRKDCMIFGYQQLTLDIVAALRSIAPEGHGFSDDFRQIIRNGSSRKFKLDDNQHWPTRVGPIVDACLHAKCLLELVVQCADQTGLPAEFSFLGIAMLMPLFAPRTPEDIP